MVKLSNPIAFTPGPVTVLTTIVYVALIVSLIVIHTTVPPAPRSATPVKGVNITEAWRDLQSVTRAYHPYNSRNNDDVREYLLERIGHILEVNGAKQSYANATRPPQEREYRFKADKSAVYVFNDLISNVTSSTSTTFGIPLGISTYFEGTNIIVYIRGTEDDESKWWEDKTGAPSRGGVMVDAHYDSVSTGFGATDDGVGVTTVLQLIKYYSTPGNRPKRGFLALLNNGEEDGLNGAKAFGQHPLSKFPRTFITVEGAGAGGRAHLFRASDTEVVRAYKNAPAPFSNVIANDAYKTGAIRSQTDYVVFNGDYGMRGMDIAFFEPRARYHTDEDDTRHTGKDSLWSMLSATLETTKALTSDTSDRFEGGPNRKGKVPAGNGSVGVWFDMFGQALAVFELHTFFALSITLLVVAPVFLLLTSIILYKVDKFYLFSGSRLYHVAEGDEEIPLYGWRGFFRYPVIFIFASAAPVALAFLLTKQNPLIIHSSPWSVWAMMFSSWVFVAWFLCCAAYFTRPTALTRIYGYLWMLALFWAILVADTVFETNMKVAAGYFFIFYFAALFLVTWISLLELFGLPKKSKHCHEKMDDNEDMSNSQILASDYNERASDANHTDAEEEDANESTSLLRGERRTTFANYTRNEDETGTDALTPRSTSENHSGAFGDEQDWSASLPRWTWLIQTIILAPIAIIFCAQTGFLLVSGMYQTGTDGSSVLAVYLIQAIFTVLILVPTMPVLHRFTYHIPIFLLLVLIGTLIYNLIAFPFSTNNRDKIAFQQTVDLDTGFNNISLYGLNPYLHQIISKLPSAAGQTITCSSLPHREPIEQCFWSGLPPHVVTSGLGSRATLVEKTYKSWVNFNVTAPSPSTPSNPNSARFHLGGKDTRACKLVFDKPISNVHVLGSGPSDKRFPSIPEGGSRELRLWSRTWNRAWGVDIEWDDEDTDTTTTHSLHQEPQDGIFPQSNLPTIAAPGTGLTGRVVCLWSDDNQLGLIPALDEIRHFGPGWSAVTKYADGLVEGSKKFSI